MFAGTADEYKFCCMSVKGRALEAGPRKAATAPIGKADGLSGTSGTAEALEGDEYDGRASRAKRSQGLGG